MKQSASLILITLLLVLLAALSVVIIYPKSFSPLIAIALFSGSVIRDKKLAMIVPLIAMLLIDVIFQVFNIATGFYGWAQIIDFATMAAITLISSYLVKRNAVNIILFSVIACVTFYLVSNTAYFIFTNPIYHTFPQTFTGYIDNMVAAALFMWKSGQILSTAVYAAVFFGAYALSEKFYAQRQLA